MQKRVKEYMREHRMVEAGDRVLVGLSGGADSVCLLCLLYEMQEELNIEISALHVHHGLRGQEADRDRKYAEELCRKLKVPCFVVHRDVAAYANAKGLSTEEAGRILRYEAFEEEAKRLGEDGTGVKIAVAHHGDDQAETILHNLLRGSGLKGLGGMPPVRDKIIRPLLCCSRVEILEYLRQKRLNYCEDSTNAESDYTRNKLRNQILPLLVSQINQGAVEHILQAGEIASQADEYLVRKAKEILLEYGRGENERVEISRKILWEQETILQTYIIFEMLQKWAGNRKDIASCHVELIRELLKKEVGAQVDLPYALTAGVTYDDLWIEKKVPFDLTDKQEEKPLPALVFTCFSYEKHMKIPEKRYTKWFDYDKIESTLSVRIRQTGDYMVLKDGGRKTVKAFMIDEKIPREQREQIPVLAEKNHVLWIVGYRISEYYKVTDQTRQVLQVEMNEGENHGR